jgi:hypothetical protein
VFSAVSHPVVGPSRERRRGTHSRDETHKVFGPGIWWIGSMMKRSGSGVQILQMYSTLMTLWLVLKPRSGLIRD